MQDDESLYEQVLEELESGDIRRWLWAKAQVSADGDAKAAKVAYIRLRADQLKEESRQRQAAEAKESQRRRVDEIRRKFSGYTRQEIAWLVIVFLGVIASLLFLLSLRPE